MWHAQILRSQSQFSDLRIGSILANGLNINSLTHLKSSHKFINSQPAQIHNLISVQSTCRTRSSSVATQLDHLQLPRERSPNALLDINDRTCGISSLRRSVKFILFTLLMVHLVYVYHLITTPVFTNTIYHSLSLLL